jgi:hypothetical protein
MHETLSHETLEDALGRVRAPEELWHRIEEARARRNSERQSASRGRKMVWSLAAAVVFAGIAWNLPRPEFRSNDPAAIRAWVQQHAGIDLPLAHTGAARIESVRLERSGVQLAYRADGRLAAVSVARGPHEKAHWSANGTAYVLACATPGDLDLSCGLCHL